MKKNSILSIMKNVYQQDLKLEYDSTFLYCYETMNTLIVSGFFVTHPLQKHICAHYLWSKDNIMGSYPESLTDNVYNVNISRINATIFEKLENHSIAFLLRPHDSTAKEEAEEFKKFIDTIYFQARKKKDMICIPTLQKYLMKTNLESYPLTECINELKMMQILSEKNIESYIKELCDLDKLAYIGRIWYDDKNMYPKENTVLRELMGAKITTKEHQQAMKDLQRFTKEQKAKEHKEVVDGIKESIPKPSNYKKAIERNKEPEPEVKKPKYTEPQRVMMKQILTMIRHKISPITAIYKSYDSDTKNMLNYYLENVGVTMTEEQVNEYIKKDFSYEALIEYIKETTDIDLKKVMG